MRLNKVWPRTDLIGTVFGRLTVVGLSSQSTRGNRGRPMWSCKCECGRTKIINGRNLIRGLTLSCGCLRNERTRAARVTHGETPVTGWSREYRAWNSMKQRCFNPKHAKYNLWGGRGITVCERWRDDFTAFLEDMGRCPSGLTLDRIDNNGHYQPDNCRWASWSQQRRNQRRA